VTVKVKFSVFRTIWGFNFIPWERVIFFYMGSFSWKGRATPEKKLKNFKQTCRWDFIQCYSLPKTTSVSFPFSSFLFPSQYQHSIPSSIYANMDTFYTGFSLCLCAGWPTSVLSFRCLFLGGKYFKSMSCRH
jgi:hypothetical protein